MKLGKLRNYVRVSIENIRKVGSEMMSLIYGVT